MSEDMTLDEIVRSSVSRVSTGNIHNAAVDEATEEVTGE